ncbi:helix-turn-helix domain-containing protein [Phyllobacterium zundukense]|uniref:HTH cro/C1-type domain-containing protein n=1 Tax=Phyllobacterium zundukense TaxID=1867719 RepID=A0A2N9W383_9HYPH|nr:helix-turn-helix transcriptional regulator [Phyllobacterium zundukense]ATU94405.1 hypothetical protein BLM14_21975 [Phyllobacterium zundukense]PIO46201.1 hypothetical protein B5P45_03590 [Phyllobacterium zundukense]
MEQQTVLGQGAQAIISIHCHPVDLYVGQQIRRRREAIGVSQQALARKAGISFQQIQKYERGKNRVSASKLYVVACALRVPITYFFPEIDETDPIPTNGPD